MSNSSASDVNGPNAPDYSPFETLRENSKKIDQWLERNIMTMSESFSENEKKRTESREKARTPKIRWVNDDDEFQQIPDIFKRQDRKDHNRDNSFGARSRRALLFLLVIVALLSFPAGYFHTEISGLTQSLFNGFDEIAGDEAGGQNSGNGLATGDLLKARAALKSAMQAQPGQRTSEVSAPEEPVKAPAVQAPRVTASSAPAADNRQTNAARQQTIVARQPSPEPSKPIAAANDNSPAQKTLRVQPPVLTQTPKSPVTAALPAPATEPSPDTIRQVPEMVAIPGGEFIVPLMRGENVLDPAATVTVQPFEVSRREVSRGDWLACATRGPCTTDAFESDFFARDNLDLPMTAVTLAQTLDYIAWLNGERPQNTPEFRLPTDAEWVIAARGGTREPRLFPWGDSYDTAHIPASRDLVPVNEAGTLNGLQGIVGNAEERTSDCWTAQTRPDGCYGGLGVVRGAPAGDANEQTTALSFRSSRSVDAPYSTVGFRLAR